MMTKKLGSMAIAIAAFAMACADSTGLDRTLVPGSLPSFDVAVNPGVANTLLFPPPAGMTGGQVRVCKDTPAGDPSLNWSFSVTVASEIDNVPLNPPIAPATPVVIPGVAGGAPECAIVFHSVKSGSELDRVTVVEQALPANWSLTHIHIDRYADGAGYVPPAGTPLDAGNLGTRTATLYINQDMERVVTFTNDFTATGTQGCTPGYWKQEHHFDSWNALYDPSDDFDATFGVDLFNPNITLEEALNLGGGKGGLNQLARAAVAALLNAAEGFYPMTTAQVIAAVQGATPATYESVKDTFDANNNLGCPLN